MKLYSIVTVLLLLVALCASTATATFRICHTNDFHAKYLEVGASNVKCKWWDAVEDKCYSGIARLVTALNTLGCDFKIQAGDWVQGSMLDTVFKQQIAIAAYKWAQYDLAVFGNHEFDYGLAHINETIHAIAPYTAFLASNVFFDDDNMADLPLYRHMDMHDICWVSTLTQDTFTMSAVPDNVRIEKEAKYIRKAIHKCAQHDNVIAVTHQGYDEDVKMCHSVHHIDLIIGGHSHTNLDDGKYPVKITRKDGSICYVTQTFAHGRFVGVLDVTFDNGVIHLPSSAYVPMDARIKRDPEVLAKVAMFDAQVQEKASEVVGHVSEAIAGGMACDGPTELPADGSPVRGDCAMGALVCDAMLAYLKGSEDVAGRPRVCLLNGGGVRTSFAKGPVTVRDVVNVLPFGNSLGTLSITGATLRAAVMHGMSTFNLDRRGFPASFGNMVVDMIVDDSKPDADSVSVGKIMVQGVELDDVKEYSMVTSTYLANGGSSYEWGGAEVTDLGTLLREALQTYLGANDPYSPAADARYWIYGAQYQNVAAAKPVLEQEDGRPDVMDEKAGIETELDDSLVNPTVSTCVGGKCSS